MPQPRKLYLGSFQPTLESALAAEIAGYKKSRGLLAPLTVVVPTARPDTERYRPQMRAYCEALEKVADIKVDEVLLYFLATGQEVKL